MYRSAEKWWNELRVCPNPWSGNGVLSHVVVLFEIDLHQFTIKVISDYKIQVSLCVGEGGGGGGEKGRWERKGEEGKGGKYRGRSPQS